MKTAETCPGCGEPITVGVGLGFCPACIVSTTVLAEAENTEEEEMDDGSEWIGPYRIERMLAEGGFGEVYLARQKKPIPRKVALKILKRGMDTRQVVARFKAEEQALALMDHKSIATVYDAGETDDGRPFFAMEFVDGKSITKFCNDYPLSFEEMLELFREVCLAVHHAHQKGIIHRDLKPSNVMVTLIDGKPAPKVIDFGIAKARQNVHLEGTTMITGLHETIGTPEYMSPEQTQSGGIDIDTRSDIYSLGILLYEILTGSPPFKLGTKKSVDDLRHSVLHEDPPKPTMELASASEHLEQSARMRNMEPAVLKRRIKGDLEWIVMKAIDKERERRYASAAAFAEDIRCLLHFEPVRARPPSFFYQAGKYIRRHRTGVALAAVVLLSGVATAVGLGSAHRKSEASAVYTNLLVASPDAVPMMLERTDEYLGVLRKQLRRVADDPDASPSQGLRASLALLPAEPLRLNEIGDRMPNATPGELKFALQRLGSRGSLLVDRSVKTLAQIAALRETRLRAAAVLAQFAPENPQLMAKASDVAYWLMLESPDTVDAWKDLFRPISESLIARLREFYVEDSSDESKAISAMFLGDYRKGDVEFLVGLLKIATPAQLPFVVSGLEAGTSEEHSALRAELERSLDDERSEFLKNERAAEMARVAVALIELGRPEHVWSRLKHDGEEEDPRLRTEIIHGMSKYGVDPAILVSLFSTERDVSIRRAALMALGSYDDRTFSPASRDRFRSTLEDAFRNEADAGIHSPLRMAASKVGVYQGAGSANERAGGTNPGTRRGCGVFRQ